MSAKFFMGILGMFLLIIPSAWSAEKERMQDSKMQHERLQEGDRQDEKMQARDRRRDEERIFGWQLMTPVERQIHRQKMRSLKTREEREAYRKEHHERMKQRAEEKGLELQNMPE